MTIQQLLLGGVPMTFATWNPADKHAEVTLSSDNLTASSTSISNRSVRATVGKSAGKWYWEVRIGVSASFGYFGVADSTESLASFIGGSVHGWAYRNDGVKITGGGAAVYGAGFTTGDIIGVALDMDAGSIVFYKNGVSQGTAFTGLTGTIYPAVTVGASTTSTAIANFGASSFSYPLADYGVLTT